MTVMPGYGVQMVNIVFFLFASLKVPIMFFGLSGFEFKLFIVRLFHSIVECYFYVTVSLSPTEIEKDYYIIKILLRDRK
jgi:hypothetical protein